MLRMNQSCKDQGKTILNVKNEYESPRCSKLGKDVALCRLLQVIHLKMGPKLGRDPMYKAQTTKRMYFVLLKITVVLKGRTKAMRRQWDAGRKSWMCPPLPNSAFSNVTTEIDKCTKQGYFFKPVFKHCAAHH